MKKQTIQIFLGFFLIFTAFSSHADFSPTSQGYWGTSSGCTQSQITYETACSLDSCSDANSSTVDVLCPGSETACGGTSNSYGSRGKWVWPCSAGASISCVTGSTLNTATSKCSCNAGLRENSSVGLISTTYSCDTAYSEPSSDILAYAIGAGLFSGGTAATFAACGLGANPACIASVLTAAAGAGLALATYLNSGDTSPVSASPDPCAGKTCISVQIDPNKPITGSDTYVSRDAQGNFKPEGQGWNNNGDGTHTAPVTDGTVTVDTNSDRVTSTVTNSSGATSSTVVQSGNDGGGVEVVSEGKTSSGTYTHQVKGGITGGAVVTTQVEAQTGTAPSGGFYQNGSIGGTSGTGGGDGSGDSGSGTGSGTGSGSGDCATYGCAKEVTQLKVLDALKGGGEIDHTAQAQSALDGVTNGLDDLMNDYKDTLSQKIDQFLQDTSLKDTLDQLGDFNPLNFDTSTCVIESNLFGHQLNLSYCDEQPTIHLLLGFIFFVWFVFAVTNLILQRNH